MGRGRARTSRPTTVDPEEVVIRADRRPDFGCTQDLGAFMMMEHMQREHGRKADDVRYFLTNTSGGARCVRPKQTQVASDGEGNQEVN